jgi:hypothetical protein
MMKTGEKYFAKLLIELECERKGFYVTCFDSEEYSGCIITKNMPNTWDLANCSGKILYQKLESVSE